MNSVKIGDIIKPYSGEGNIEDWLAKLSLVVKVSKIKNEAEVIPMFLEGSPIALYLQMNEEEKESADLIKEKLRRVFGLNPFSAYDQLINKKWRGEPMDIYALELERLARIAEVNNEKTLIRAFVVGLPEEIGRELRSLPEIEETSLSQLIFRARALVSSSKGEVAASVMNASRRTNEIEKLKEKEVERKIYKGRIKCAHCKMEGHHFKNCRKRLITCWNCGNKGHFADNCDQGNEQTGATVQEVVPVEDSENTYRQCK